MVFDWIFLVSNAGDSMAKYNGGYLVDTVFDNSKLVSIYRLWMRDDTWWRQCSVQVLD
mgnify:CR=1 FL=1